MSGCHIPEFEKCNDKSCIACHGGVWGSIHPPMCNGKIRNSMIKPEIATYEDFIRSRIVFLEAHKTAQIDENRKISRRVDELEAHINKLHDMINLEDRITASDVLLRLTDLENGLNEIKEDIEDLQVFRHAKLSKPYKCPVCGGQGGTKISGTIDEECFSCKGRGIVWG